MNAHIQRAMLLMDQSRHALAQEELQRALGTDPNDPLAHALLSLCLAAQEKFEPATTEAQAAIGLAPDMAYAHYALARVLHLRNREDEADAAVREAIALDPEQSAYHGLASSIAFARRRWSEALEAAERGLLYDSEDVTCNNLRAMALVKLGRKEEAGQTIDAALARDPDNALTHANQGWTLLSQGETTKAAEHFREALRLDPENEWARQGILEALKAKNFLYRWMLYYFFWMQRLSPRTQWFVILGAYFGMRLLRGAADNNPTLGLVLAPLFAVYILFAYLTWTAQPLFNLLLRLNKFGRLTLSREQIVQSNFVGGCLLVAILALAAAVALGQSIALMLGLYALLLVIPISATFACQRGWPRNAMFAYTVGLTAIGIAALVYLAADIATGETLSSLFLLGCILGQFAGVALTSVTVRR